MTRYKAATSEVFQLTEAQRRAVELIAAGELANVVAEKVGTTVEEIAEWRQAPAFITATNTLLQNARESTRQRLRALAAQALDTVAGVIEDQATPPQLRLQAALKVLDMVGAGQQAKEAIGAIDPAEVAKEQERTRLMNSLF